METERTPFVNKPVPQYSFFGTGRRPSKINITGLQCCLWAALFSFLLVVMAILLTYFLTSWVDVKTNINDTETEDVPQLKLPLQDEKYIEQFVPNLNDQEEALQTGVLNLRKREAIENFLPSVPVDSPTYRHHLATYTSKEAQEMSKLGFIINTGTKSIEKCMNNNTSWNKNKEKPRKWHFYNSLKWVSEKLLSKNFNATCSKSPYRSINGTCNNLDNDKTWGAAMQPFRRILLPKYEDGISEPRKAVNGNPLPSAREVSLAIHRPMYRNDINFTVMLAVWGQFIDHDITATAISKGKNGAAISCCDPQYKHPECFSISIKKSDPFYKKYNVLCLNFVRSAPAPIKAFGPREQLNQVTSFLDGSVIYGSDDDLTNNLRTFGGGELKMLQTPFGELLPVSNDPDDECNRENELKRGRYCFLSGDARSNENLLLTSLHLLFARQHNFIARQLSEINPVWEDEKIFQESRRIVAAQIQYITYNEFLPSILPKVLIKRLNLTEDADYFQHYNSSIDPTIANSFASAAFRFGHTLLPGLMRFLHFNATHEEYLELHKMLFNPFKLFESESLESILKSISNTHMQQADVYFNKDLTQKLFQKDDEGPCGLDLVALNIQRGRDHGLPPYPNWVEVCGLPRPKSFDDLNNTFDIGVLDKMKKLYNSVDDIDLYTGGLAEKPINGGLVGPTITCILADQFYRLKAGDRFWYGTEEEPQKFKPGQLSEIRKTTLAKIICKTSMINSSQPQVMRRIGDDNVVMSCNEFEYPNLELWKEKL